MENGFDTKDFWDFIALARESGSLEWGMIAFLHVYVSLRLLLTSPLPV